MKLLICLAIVVGMVGSVIGVCFWLDRVDSERQRGYAAYENCVQEQYGMTPIEWYELNNRYPLCGN